MQQRTAPFDIDKWDPTSLTWRPDGHAKTELEARRLCAHRYGKNKTAKFRVREKSKGTILFEIGESKVFMHPSIAPQKEK